MFESCEHEGAGEGDVGHRERMRGNCESCEEK